MEKRTEDRKIIYLYLTVGMAMLIGVLLFRESTLPQVAQAIKQQQGQCHHELCQGRR